MNRFEIFSERGGENEDGRAIAINVDRIFSIMPGRAGAYTVITDGNGNDVYLSDEFPAVLARVNHPATENAGSSDQKLAEAASLIRDALSGVELIHSNARNSIPARMLRDRLNGALALIGGENTNGPSLSGEPTAMPADDVATLITGVGVRVYDRRKRAILPGVIARRGAPPAGVEVRISRTPGDGRTEREEHFDNTGRSVMTMANPVAQPGNLFYIPRFYLVHDDVPGSASHENWRSMDVREFFALAERTAVFVRDDRRNIVHPAVVEESKRAPGGETHVTVKINGRVGGINSPTVGPFREFEAGRVGRVDCDAGEWVVVVRDPDGTMDRPERYTSASGDPTLS